jgi:DNA polymerase-3 subunit epsilon
MYSIVDIEATGGNAKIGRITEIAIYCFDGEKVTGEYSSLVNPERPIPAYVQKLTGINNKMASKAPIFRKIAPDVFKLLDNSIIVGHNVKADYSFLKSEMQKADISFRSERLCTLELSKLLIPQAPSHGLDNICNHLNIKVPNRHRAAGDALATVELFRQLMQLDKENLIKRLKRNA